MEVGYNDSTEAGPLITSDPLPPLTIKGMRLPLPIFQGGMGVGVSLYPLAAAVALAGGLGLLSSACLDRIVSERVGHKVDTYEAVGREVAAAKAGGGSAGINIMVALQCDKGYVLLKDAQGRFTRCPAKEDNEHSFCICNGLCSAAGYDADQEEPLYTAGTSAARVDRIIPVSDLMAELAGMRDALPSAA